MSKEILPEGSSETSGGTYIIENIPKIPQIKKAPNWEAVRTVDITETFTGPGLVQDVFREKILGAC